MRNLKQHVSDSIPSDLLINIFSRLAKKSIARFRCVSKSWASIIRSPYFTEQFVKTSRFLITFEEDGKLFFSSLPKIQEQDNNSSSLVVDHVAYFPTDVPSQISRPINGLMCLQYLKKTESVTVVYNISTGDTVTLPEVRTKRIKSRSYFGYDPIEKQFKVLSMTWSLYGIGIHNASQEQRVLTLGNVEKVWRKVEFCRPHYPLYDGICINGVLYYLAEENRCSRASLIVCFDVRSEKFCYINIDESMVIRRDSTLINYKGKLGLLNNGVRSVSKFWLWILVDAEKHKWSKHLYQLPYWDYKHGEQLLYFAGLAGTGEIVLSPYFLYDPFYLIYFNLEKKTIRKVQVRGLEFKKRPKVHILM